MLPPRTSKPSGYSSKVLLGGVPWDISEQLLIQTFKQFGPIRVEWPGKEKQASQPKGYVYIIFESEKNVRALLQACTNDHANSGNWYFKISSKRMKAKEVSETFIQIKLLLHSSYYENLKIFKNFLCLCIVCLFFYCENLTMNCFDIGSGDPMDFERLKLHQVHIAEAGSFEDSFCWRPSWHAER